MMGRNDKTDNENKEEEFQENQQPRHSDAPDVPTLKEFLFGRKNK